LTKRPLKIAITGTHSTGKSTFLDKLESSLKSSGLNVERFGSLALEARKLDFPILRGHTVDSTLWIIGECIRREAVATLRADVILIDRPVSDALGYLEAALEVSGRTVEPQRLDTVKAIARGYMHEYDIVIETILDLKVPLGAGRDADSDLRAAAGRCINEFAAAYGPTRLQLTAENQSQVLEQVLERIST